jgi:hypothetical protein
LWAYGPIRVEQRFKAKVSTRTPPKSEEP